jgi:hypothetical protein
MDTLNPATPVLGAKEALAYIFAGNSTVTFQSAKTSKWITYRIRKAKNNRHFAVSVLTGSDNRKNDNYTYIGYVDIFEKSSFWPQRPRPRNVREDVLSAFSWSLKALDLGGSESLRVYHEGRCGRCGRKLTTPQSILSGFGSECIKHVGGPSL